MTVTRLLSPGDFEAFFAAVHHSDPFPWQTELAERLCTTAIPPVIDVPTGLGKTSVMLCWAFALAVQAQGATTELPRRLCFVVDRRLVVDSAFEGATALARVLSEAEPGSVTGAIAEALLSLHGSDEPPLSVVRMRGGVSWESRWLTRPDQAAIVIGTVDQFGSRLLFRGYGVSEGMRPINAALVGLDTWLVVDEAHIAEPLRQTVEAVTGYQQLTEAEGALGLRPLRYTLMSATVAGASTSAGDVAPFRPDLDTQMEASPTARQRLETMKPVALVDLASLASAQRRQWRAKAEQLGQTLAELARVIAPPAGVVAVVANTIGTARAAHETLLASDAEAILLIGRVREHERERLLARWLPEIGVGAERTRDRPLYVVATQTIEVGANVDFDALVTECAPLSALIQRFGRVNRTGIREPHRSLIVHAGFAHGASREPDRIYGEATPATWQYLSEHAPVVAAGKRLPVQDILGADTFDLGLLPARALAEDAPAAVREQPPFTPLALGAHFERWAATAPAPDPDQPIAPFLHGVGRDIPEVQVAWRVSPPADDRPDAERWMAWLDLVPPVEWEFVSVPLWEAQALLRGEPSDQAVADIEGAIEPQVEAPAESDPEQVAILGVVHRGRGQEPGLVRAAEDVRPGDRLVLDPGVGGHDQWGWTGRRRTDGGRPVPDVGDLAPTRRRAVLRLARSVIDTLVPVDSHEAVREAFAALDPDDLPSSSDQVVSALRAALPEQHVLQPLLQTERWRAEATEFRSSGRPVVFLSGATGPRAAHDTRSDQDEASTSLTGRPVTLDQHGADVGAMAREFAEQVGLPAELVRAAELAARYHDTGKADPRFQVMLHDGDRLAADAATSPLAKSGRDASDPRARAAARIAALPRRFRHEQVSARLLEALYASTPEWFAGLDLDLVRHLVASHHGHARPLWPPIMDPHAPAVSAEIDGVAAQVPGAIRQVDWSHPARFEALSGRYGWWGLAYLETLVRLADMLCSERDSRAGEPEPLASIPAGAASHRSAS